MSTLPDTTAQEQAGSRPGKRRWSEAIGVYRHPRVATMLFLGFAAGLPFLLVFSTLSAWLREVGVSRTEIGYFSWIGITYSFKFVWAPVVDRLKLPFLTNRLGRRRSWMFLAQAVIVAGLFGMSLVDPKASTVAIALLALLVAFASATQDIAIDAFRIEAADNSIQGAMAAAYQFGYRIAILAAGAGTLYIAEFVDWRAAYQSMAALGFVGIVATLIISEPAILSNPQTVARERRVLEYAQGLGSSTPEWLRGGLVWFYGGVVCPFVDFFQRNGLFAALTILLFISLFRLSDITMGVMANPFYIDLGFSKDQIADIAKIYGFALTMAGAFLGGVLVYRVGAPRLLALSVILTAGTNLMFALMAFHGRPDLGLLTLAISADNFAGGIAGSVFIAYLSGLTNTAYTATQYALFSSLMTLPGKFTGGFSGAIVDVVQKAADGQAGWLRGLATGFGAAEDFAGYFVFFLYTTALGIPALLLSLLVAYMALHRRQPELQPPPTG